MIFITMKNNLVNISKGDYSRDLNFIKKIHKEIFNESMTTPNHSKILEEFFIELCNKN